MLLFVPEPNVLLSNDPHINSELRITTSVGEVKQFQFKFYSAGKATEYLHESFTHKSRLLV